MKKLLLLFAFILVSTISLKAQEDKKTIAIAAFSGAYDESIIKSIEEVVTSSFAKTKRFTLVGRSQMNAINNERELQKTEAFIDSKYIAQTKSLGAQLLASGNVNSVTTSREAYTDKNGQTTMSYNSEVTLDLKVLDVETGQVVASDVIVSKANKGLLDMKGWGSLLTGSSPSNETEAFGVALKRLEEEIDDFVTKNFPATFGIVEIQEVSGSGEARTVLISGGSSFGIKKGMKLKVIELVEMEVGGKKINRKKQIGEVKVTKVEDENFSICDVIQGGIDINSKFNAKAKLQIITKQE